MFLAAVALIVATSAATSAPLPLADLVRKTGENEVASETAFERKPCLLTIDVKELDKKGAVKDSSEIVMRRGFVDGEPHDELLRYIESGVDVTEKKKAERKKRKEDEAKDVARKNDDDDEIRSPFHPKVVESYTFEDLGADAADPDLRRIRFAPKKGATGEDLLLGEARLTADGWIRDTTAKPAKLPMLVSSIDVAATFGEAGEIVRLELKGEAGILFVKKRFRVVTNFDWTPE